MSTQLRSTPTKSAAVTDAAVTDSPGTWRHPRLDEITRRRNATTFTEKNVRQIAYNTVTFLGLWAVEVLGKRYLGPQVFPSEHRPFISWVWFFVKLVPLLQIVLACLPLIRKEDDLADVPLTAAQRKLLGLAPSSALPTPDAKFSTPPRYSRTPSIAGSLLPPTMASKVDRIVTRLQEKIQEGDFYEAQQQTRVAASRYIKTQNWPAAIDILFNVSQSLLKAGQGGSGGDLCNMMVDVYKQAELKPDSPAKGKVLTCLRLFDAQEPTRKKFITEMVGWSAKFGEFPAGDPELHHVIGSLYAEEHETYEAERHLLLGTRDSPEVLLKMEYAWYKEGEPHTAPYYAARAVLPYLLVGNVRAANTCYRLFTSALSSDNPGLGVQDVASAHSDIRIFPSLPLLNFLGLLLLAIQRGAPEVYKGLVSKYSGQLAEAEGWSEPLDMIAEMYFGITKPRQSNPLMDMMSGLFGGGGAAPPQQQRRGPRPLDGPAPAGLD
ncbi:Golgi to ER traffic protein 4 [Paramyrothecium foliicola]|nr:Golgi to ER traffic protein 4 [Paramyrothecium foliicola]